MIEHLLFGPDGPRSVGYAAGGRDVQDAAIFRTPRSLRDGDVHDTARFTTRSEPGRAPRCGRGLEHHRGTVDATGPVLVDPPDVAQDVRRHTPRVERAHRVDRHRQVRGLVR